LFPMEIIAALVFSFLLVGISFVINRRLLQGRLVIDVYHLALTASSVLLLAIIAESLINPFYESWFGSKLWVYHVFPLYDGNVSALAVIVWSAYGIHLYFTRQSLEKKLRAGWNHNGAKALIVGLEAPFIFEVSGNLLFLLLSNNYYAYYLPADVYHLTSLQVIPVYTCCVFFGLLILKQLEGLPRLPILPPALFASGIAYLFAGSVLK